MDALRTAGRLAQVVIGLVPLGTGNDFAATLELPDVPIEAAAVITAGRTRQIDLIIDGQDEVVVNAAHIGIGAEAAKAARPWKKIATCGRRIRCLPPRPSSATCGRCSMSIASSGNCGSA